MPPTSSKAVEIALIPDPITRARACTTFITNGRRTLDEVAAIRIDTLRELRAARYSRSQIALKTGTSINVVIDALRRHPDQP